MTIDSLEGETIIEGTTDNYRYKAGLTLTIIRLAWDKGCSFELEADGFGPGQGTHGDWSAIRDSSHDSIRVMLEKSLNYLMYDLKRR